MPQRSTARRPRRRRWLAAALAATGIAVLATGGCSTLGYYAHLAAGEAHVLARREPLQKVIDDPATPQRLRERLQAVRQARAFASDHLGLPRNASYTTYADIDRPFVMYNVFATPPLSLRPIEHCFPIAGCVAYRGYYRLDRAQREAERLRLRGDDVYIGGVPAYSTLGHFADPVLSSMDRWSRDQLIGTIFHELAHQKLYVKGDTRFNESFATFVQRQGLRAWHRAEHTAPSDPQADAREHQFTQLVLATRRRLRALYAGGLPDAQKLARKQAIFAQLRQQYRDLRDRAWHGQGDYDAWIDGPLNNAKLLPFGLYDQWEPAFAQLFARAHGRWPAFYAEVERLARQPRAARDRRLQALAAASTGTPTRSVDRADPAGTASGPTSGP